MSLMIKRWAFQPGTFTPPHLRLHNPHYNAIHRDAIPAAMWFLWELLRECARMLCQKDEFFI